MRSQKVFNNGQVKWFDEELTRLNFQMVFNESEQDEKDAEQKYDPEELQKRLNQRDESWKKKLKHETEQAFEEGFEKGRKEGLKAARLEIDSKLEVIRKAIEKGHEEWQQRHKLIEPGVLDLAFEISENILGVPVKDPKIQETLSSKLIPIFQKLDHSSRPVLKVSEHDLEHVKELKQSYAGKLTMFIESDENCNPGEFELDTNDETIVYKFREMLKEFKKNLNLPTWN